MCTEGLSRFSGYVFCVMLIGGIHGRDECFLNIVAKRIFSYWTCVPTSVTNVLIHFLPSLCTFALFSCLVLLVRSVFFFVLYKWTAQTYLIQLRFITLHGQHRNKKKNYAVIKLIRSLSLFLPLNVCFLLFVFIFLHSQ